MRSYCFHVRMMLKFVVVPLRKYEVFSGVTLVLVLRGESRVSIVAVEAGAGTAVVVVLVVLTLPVCTVQLVMMVGWSALLPSPVSLSLCVCACARSGCRGEHVNLKQCLH